MWPKIVYNELNRYSPLLQHPLLADTSLNRETTNIQEKHNLPFYPLFCSPSISFFILVCMFQRTGCIERMLKTLRLCIETCMHKHEHVFPKDSRSPEAVSADAVETHWLFLSYCFIFFNVHIVSHRGCWPIEAINCGTWLLKTWD